MTEWVKKIRRADRFYSTVGRGQQMGVTTPVAIKKKWNVQVLFKSKILGTGFIRKSGHASFGALWDKVTFVINSNVLYYWWGDEVMGGKEIGEPAGHLPLNDMQVAVDEQGLRMGEMRGHKKSVHLHSRKGTTLVQFDESQLHGKLFLKELIPRVEKILDPRTVDFSGEKPEYYDESADEDDEKNQKITFVKAFALSESQQQIIEADHSGFAASLAGFAKATLVTPSIIRMARTRKDDHDWSLTLGAAEKFLGSALEEMRLEDVPSADRRQSNVVLTVPVAPKESKSKPSPPPPAVPSKPSVPDAPTQTKGKLLFNFEGGADKILEYDQLSAVEGTIVTLPDYPAEVNGWCLAQLSNGKKGYIPVSYVKKIVTKTDLKAEIRAVIKKGVPLWNNDDFAGCTKLYRTLALRYAEVDVRLAEAAEKAANEPPKQAGWTLRTAMDSILGVAPPAKKRRTGTIRKGFMEKEGGGYFSGWTNRYFVLDANKTLKYYTGEDMGTLKGTVDLNKMKEVRRPTDGKMATGLEVVCTDRTWYFKTTDQKTAQDWITDIEEVTSISTT